ncbi:hypothetical protein CD145_10120 [Staphylococcus saccharolyticus]|nr:hypothetical protein CD145_10120 [Staphylococcus saccharolyticus]TAA97019.1 hypothetical protein DMB72_09540 [Staphylococcus saccharolyticus]TAA97366.1 hypothetical protein DMB73_09530 [Staphylococcus saccharolyticus]TAB01716.1 hypothetical protein DMB78_09540 [Staphylococcus saccharolyticus]
MEKKYNRILKTIQQITSKTLNNKVIIKALDTHNLLITKSINKRVKNRMVI